ncbi:hypothetical protein D8674_004333 [Pyrus ussuriensis x Pyrus communis]|uniref:Uncharacterized protein n=1 Tax=Pyrus ussuriensis x Pyrus communis TaxID=2448454 RepID=A0A5N5FJK3_9ROSA|nr:hypothetical protein D8674_004333 [Pyrus ussuriensis x Pyrus communis]
MQRVVKPRTLHMQRIVKPGTLWLLKIAAFMGWSLWVVEAVGECSEPPTSPSSEPPSPNQPQDLVVHQLPHSPHQPKIDSTGSPRPSQPSSCSPALCHVLGRVVHHAQHQQGLEPGKEKGFCMFGSWANLQSTRKEDEQIEKFMEF